MKLAELLEALSIEGATENTWKKVINAGFNTPELIIGMSREQLSQIGKDEGKTVGEKRADRIYNSLHSSRIQNLLINSYKWLDNKPEIKSLNQEVMTGKMNLLGKRVVMTGAGPRSRSELENELKSMGAIPQDSINKETNLLITADPTSQSSKTQKANKLGIEIVSYNDVF